MKNFGFSFLLVFTASWAQAQSFVDTGLEARSCGGRISCGPIQVTEQDRRVRPAIEQPRANAPTMGLCGSMLPSGLDYQARTGETVCGGAQVSRTRLPIPVDQDKKDRADQILASANDDLSKRTRAQELLRTPLEWKQNFDIAMNETWSYTAIEGDFGGPAETYATTCARSRTEEYFITEDIMKDECAEWRTEEAPAPRPTYSAPTSSGTSSGGSSSGAPRRDDSDRMRGTSRPEIQQRSRDNYDRIKQRRNSSSYVLVPERTIAQSRTCVRYRRVKVGERQVSRTRSLAPLVGACTALRGTWRTYPVVKTGSRACAPQRVSVNVSFAKDPSWTPSNPQYLDILPNKFDLLPGESETMNLRVNDGPSRTLTASLNLQNAWNRYEVQVSPQHQACSMEPKQINVSVHTLERIKRRAPNPFALPEGREPLVGLDDKGRPRALTLIDQARSLRLDASQNSRRFSNIESLGTSEAGGSQAYWVGTQFRMTLYRVDNWGRKFAVTLPNSFTTNATDVFDNEMQMSLGGQGGMDRLYRPAGPLQFLFGSLYSHFGVELSPNTNYVLEVKAAQREFPFYESTCRSGDVTCGSEGARDEMFSESIEIPFKTKETNRSWLKWLKDLQIVIF